MVLYCDLSYSGGRDVNFDNDLWKKKNTENGGRMTDYAIEAENACKQFKDNLALKHVDLKVSATANLISSLCSWSWIPATAARTAQ